LGKRIGFFQGNMDLEDLDEYLSFLMPSKRTQATQNETQFDRFHTDGDNDITPWSDAEIPRNFLSLQKMSYAEQKPSSKQKESSEMYYSSCQPKIFQRPVHEDFYGKRIIKRLVTEGEKDSTAGSSESTTLRSSASQNHRRVLSRQHSKIKSISGSKNPPSHSDKSGPIKIEQQQVPPTTEKEIDESEQPLMSKEVSYETPFEMASSFGAIRGELNSHLQKIHQFYFPPSTKPLNQQIRKNLTRSKLSMDKSKNATGQDSSKDLHKNRKALILIKSYRDVRPMSIAESKKTCVYKNLPTNRSKSKETLIVDRYATEIPTLNSALTGEKTRLNDFSQKFTPYGNFNLEKRGNFFKEKSVIIKPKETDEVLRNNLKLKLEILRKIGRKDNSVNNSTSKSRENSVKIRTYQPNRPQTQTESQLTENLRKSSATHLATKSISSFLVIPKTKK